VDVVNAGLVALEAFTLSLSVVFNGAATTNAFHRPLQQTGPCLYISHQALLYLSQR
jgi:hypothetical protein